MAEKPTYNELERKIKQFEREVLEYVREGKIIGIQRCRNSPSKRKDARTPENSVKCRMPNSRL
jgi:hypothetical protein